MIVLPHFRKLEKPEKETSHNILRLCGYLLGAPLLTGHKVELTGHLGWEAVYAYECRVRVTPVQMNV